MKHLIYHNREYYIGSTSDYISACSAEPDERLSLRRATPAEIQVHKHLGSSLSEKRKLEKAKRETETL